LAKKVSVVAKKICMRYEIGPKNFDKFRPKPSPARKVKPDIQLWSTVPLHLQQSCFMLQRSHSKHVTVFPCKESTNHVPRKRWCHHHYTVIHFVILRPGTGLLLKRMGRS